MIDFIRSVSWQREAFIFACAIITFAFTGPFGTYDDLSFFGRLYYWSAAILGCGVFFWVTMYQTIHRPLLAGFPKLVRLIIGAALAAIPASAIVYYLQIFVRHIPVPVERLPWLWFVVLFVGIGIGVIYFISPFGQFLLPKHVHAAATDKNDNVDVDVINSTPIKFFARLPDDLGNELILLSMNDHYVEVITSKGKSMLHMKFSDAMIELGNYPGAQIHRSHWVAQSAVIKVEKRGRSHVMLMQGGGELPISGTYKNTALALVLDNSNFKNSAKQQS